MYQGIHQLISEFDEFEIVDGISTLEIKCLYARINATQGVPRSPSAASLTLSRGPLNPIPPTRIPNFSMALAQSLPVHNGSDTQLYSLWLEGTTSHPESPKCYIIAKSILKC